jgi:hypothetical protein
MHLEPVGREGNACFALEKLIGAICHDFGKALILIGERMPGAVPSQEVGCGKASLCLTLGSGEGCFTNFLGRLTIGGSKTNLCRGLLMPLSGEAIRLMNYIDDVSVTLRRVLALAANLPAEERQRVSDHLKSAKPNVSDVLSALEAK